MAWHFAPKLAPWLQRCASVGVQTCRALVCQAAAEKQLVCAIPPVTSAHPDSPPLMLVCTLGVAAGRRFAGD